MALSGRQKTDYMREYMRRTRAARKKAAAKAKTAEPWFDSCSFCNESGHDRILVSDHHGYEFICEHCITLAAAKVAERKSSAGNGNERLPP